MAMQQLLLDEPKVKWQPGDPAYPDIQVKILADGKEGRPSATIGTCSKEQRIEAHFHNTAQFQVILEGHLVFVNHPTQPIAVHYTDPGTAYGSFTADSNFKLAVLRPRKAGQWFMAEKENRKLRNIKGREVYGQSTDVEWENLTGKLAGVRRKVLFGKDNEKGPKAHILECPAGFVLQRDPAAYGEYQIITEGSAKIEGKETKPFAMHWVRGEERPAPLIAGPNGATWVLLTYDEAALESAQMVA